MENWIYSNLFMISMAAAFGSNMVLSSVIRNRKIQGKASSERSLTVTSPKMSPCGC